MGIPPGADFCTVTPDDSPSAFAAAMAETALRDMLWNSPECLADGCDHEWRLLPVVEFRQTVICGKCGGINKALSREVAENPGAFTVGEDGSIAQKVLIRRRNPAEAARLMRARLAEHGWPADDIDAFVAEVTGE